VDCLRMTPVVVVLAFAGVAAEEQPALNATVTWDSVARPAREPDTLFLPDLSSAETIQHAGGFLWGHHNETSEQVRDKYDFGPGRFGAAVKPKTGDDWTFVVYPQDGLIPQDEFTIEFWAKAEGGWAVEPFRPFFAVWGGPNRIDLRKDKQNLAVTFSTFGYHKSESKAQASLGVSGDGWQAFALTLKAGIFRLLVNGKEAVKFDSVPRLPPWSDDGWGITLGGEPHGAANVWVSDLRISRTARVPGQPVPLRAVAGMWRIAADRKARDLPPLLLGALHPGGTPEQTSAALHVIRTDKILTATPMKRGAPDGACPTPGISGLFSYDWQVCDRVFDWMKEHGVAPYISIDSTPSLLGGDVKPYAGAQLKTGLSSASGYGNKPPNNWDDWAAVVEDFVHHVLKEKKHAVPKWGVWNEPEDKGAFWSAGLEKYLELYAVTVKAVRKVDPQARVGGPETAGFSEKWIQALFQLCAKEKLPLDFVSYHDYSGLLSSPDIARAKTDEWAKAAGFPTPFPLVVGEFNWTGQNLYRTGTSRFNQGMWDLRAFGAAYTTAFLTRIVELPGFELLIYSHTSYGNPRDGGWSSTQLIGPQGEQWAPYNALKGWKTVAGCEALESKQDLPPGVYTLATRDPQTGRLGLVLANYGFAQREPRTVKVVIDGLKQGTWRMTRYLVDPKHSSRWDAAEDRPEGAPENELRKVAESAVQAAASTVLDLDLPPLSSTFVALQRER